MKTITKLILYIGLGLIGLNTAQAKQICKAPEVTTLPVKHIKAHSAVFRGKIVSKDKSALQFYFQWGPIWDPIALSTIKEIVKGPVDKLIFKIKQSNLQDSATYCVRLVVNDKCNDKTIYSNWQYFVTKVK